MTCDPLAYTGGGQLRLLLILAAVFLITGTVLLLMTRRRGRVVTLGLMLLLGGAATLITVGTPAQAFAAECPPTEIQQAQNPQPEMPLPEMPLPEMPLPELPLPETSQPETSQPETWQSETPQSETSPAESSPAVNTPTQVLEPINSLTITQTSVMDGLAPEIAPVPIRGIVSNDGTDSTYITAIAVEITGVIIAPSSAPGVCDASDYVLLDSRMPVGRTLGPGGSTEFAGASIGFSNKSTNQDTCKGATVQLLYTANPD